MAISSSTTYGSWYLWLKPGFSDLALWMSAPTFIRLTQVSPFGEQCELRRTNYTTLKLKLIYKAIWRDQLTHFSKTSRPRLLTFCAARRALPWHSLTQCFHQISPHGGRDIFPDQCFCAECCRPHGGF